MCYRECMRMMFFFWVFVFVLFRFCKGREGQREDGVDLEMMVKRVKRMELCMIRLYIFESWFLSWCFWAFCVVWWLGRVGGVLCLLFFFFFDPSFFMSTYLSVDLGMGMGMGMNVLGGARRIGGYLFAVYGGMIDLDWCICVFPYVLISNVMFGAVKSAGCC